MSKVKVLQRAATEIASWLGKADPATTRRVSARIGANIATRGISTVVNTVKDNPVTAALLLFEMGDAGAGMLLELAEEDPRVAEVVDVLRAQNEEIDEVDEDTSIADLAKFDDEFQDISTAIGILGSMDRFIALRRAVSMDESVFLLYIQARDMARNLR